MAVCGVCFRHCDLGEGQIGFCGARICAGGIVRAANYGRITSLALDPIEKKPLRRFKPGSLILSAGSYGCNLRCPFCQNYEISWAQEAMRYADRAELVTPEQIAETAQYTARLVHEKGMVNVLVSNGTAEVSVLEEILPYMDAMNIDLKGFTDRYYREVLGGDREMVMRFITRAVQSCHVELTTLIIPGENDSEEEMHKMCEWISSLEGIVPGNEIPLHISRFFPRFHMTDREATSVKKIYRLAEAAREKLKYVYTGNC